MKYGLVYGILIGLQSRSGGMRLHLYIALVALKGYYGWFLVVMKWYESMYVEWIMVGMNLSIFNCSLWCMCFDYAYGMWWNVKVMCMAKVVSRGCLVKFVLWDANLILHK